MLDSGERKRLCCVDLRPAGVYNILCCGSHKQRLVVENSKCWGGGQQSTFPTCAGAMRLKGIMFGCGVRRHTCAQLLPPNPFIYLFYIPRPFFYLQSDWSGIFFREARTLASICGGDNMNNELTVLPSLISCLNLLSLLML